MKERKLLLTKLIHLSDQVDILQKGLAEFPWDIEKPLLTFEKEDLEKVLKKVLDLKINLAELEAWANALECREDIEFKNQDLQQIIMELANPALYGILTENKIKGILRKINSKGF